MIKVTIGTTTSRKQVVVEPTKTPKDVLNENDIAFDVAVIHMDGVPLSVSELNKSFEALGVTESATLVAVIKQANAG